MSKKILWVLGLLLAGCATNSGVAPMGSDTYMVTRQAATGFSGSGDLKAEALREANQFCLSQKKEMQVDRGMTEDEAFEVACQTILAPPDGPAMSDHPPKPLDWRQREAVYKKLEEMGDEEDMREKENFQKRHGLI